MSDTKENKPNEANSTSTDVKARPRSSSHNKVDMKNLFKSKHDSKHQSKEVNGNEKPEEKKDERRKSHGKIDMKNLFKSKHDSKHQSKEVNAEEKPEEKKEEQPKPADQKPAENNGQTSNNGDTIDCEGDAKKPLDDCEKCKDEVLGETDKAVGKPITGFSEKVGASFRKWFHLAGAPKD